MGIFDKKPKTTQYETYNVYADMHFPNRKMLNVHHLPPGIYEIQTTIDGELYFKEFIPTTDNLIKLTDNESQKILKEIDYFWKPETKAKYDEYGIVYKRGLLMYGIPGTGKTATIMQTAHDMIKQDTVILYENNPNRISKALKIIHNIEPDKKVIAVLEECDEYINSSTFLSLLDGETSSNNVFFIATTNFIDRIPNRIKNRPSRFATIVEIKAPSTEARRCYLSTKLKDKNLIEKYVEATSGFVIDNIKDVIISTMIFDVSLEDAVNKVKSYSQLNEIEEIENDQDEDDE